MLNFSVCIDMMYPEADFADRIRIAKQNKASGIEFWKWSDKDLPLIEKTLMETEMTAVLMNLDSADKALSFDLSRGILSHNRKDDLVRAIHESAPVMRRLGMEKAIVLAGDIDDSIPHEKAMENIAECLRVGVDAAREEGITLVLEPLNSYDRASYVMPYSKDAFDIVKQIGSDNLKVLLDLYHTQRMEGNLIYTLESNLGYIGHFHVANSPYRCEPDLGEVDYRQVFDAIKASSYNDWIGFEYRVRKSSFSLGAYIDSLNN